jgi:hypothetical protein
MAENGDTYDFFKISYELQQGNFFYDSKRLPLYSLLLTPFSSDYFIFYGRIINNLLYFLAVFFFYKIISFKFKLENFEKYLFTLIFALNFIVFDNSFYILSDTLFLFLIVLFFYFYEKGYNWIYLLLISVLSIYTRFEGLLLLFTLLFIYFFNKEFKKFFKNMLVAFVLLIPLFLKSYYSINTGGSYLNDEVGFILRYQNVLKALGSLFFATGGFWLFTLVLNDFKSNFKDLSKKLKNNILNPYLIFFLTFSVLIVLWGFFIRLYSPIVFISLIYFIYLYKRGISFKLNYLIFFLCFLFYIYNLQFLDHFDLAYFKFSKTVSIFLSILVLIFLFYKKSFKFKYLIIFLGIIFLNLTIFIEKFIYSREKYYTIVQASEFSLKNNFKNVAYFDESGVQGWYFKDFKGNFQYFQRNISLEKWLERNKIEYIMITDEMGYQITPINNLKSEIKQLELVVTFKSSYFGGKTSIYKLNEHKINK